MVKVGYRFYPTEPELLEYFLYNKITENPILEDDDLPVKVCDLYGDKEPWDLWNFYERKDLPKDTLYFFTRLKKLSPNGSRFNRKIGSGAWQGEDGAKSVMDGGGRDMILGFRKRFRYENSNNYEQNGRWIMYEYTMNPSLLGGEYSRKALDYVLCCVKKNESGQQKEKSNLGKKQTKSKQIGEKNESGQIALSRKRKLKDAVKPNNRDDDDDSDDDRSVQKKRLKSEQETLWIQPTESPCSQNFVEIVESEVEAETERNSDAFDVEELFSNNNQKEAFDRIDYYIANSRNVLETIESEAAAEPKTERNSDAFDVEELFSNNNQREEVDCIDYYIAEGDEFVQNQYLMSEQEALQAIEYGMESETVFKLEEIFSNMDHEFDQLFTSTYLGLLEQ